MIPIESSLLYVMPLYLSSTDTQIPELKRVIVVLGDAVAMEPTLEEALSKVVGATVTPASRMTALEQVETVTQQMPTVGSTRITSPDIIRLVDQANSQYDKAQEALRRGDFAEYGRQVSSLKKTLEELRSRVR